MTLAGLLCCLLVAGCSRDRTAQPGAPAPPPVSATGSAVAAPPEAPPAAAAPPPAAGPAATAAAVEPAAVPAMKPTPQPAPSKPPPTPAAAPKTTAAAGQAKPATPAAAPPATAAAPPPQANPAPRAAQTAAAPKPAAPPLDLAGLETRLRDTKAIGVFTKLSLKNQVDDLLAKFRAYHKHQAQVTLNDLRRPYEMLLLKVLSLLQDSDPPLARDIVASREAIWSILADERKFTEAQLMAGETR